jgi:hypothetical protein
MSMSFPDLIRESRSKKEVFAFLKVSGWSYNLNKKKKINGWLIRVNTYETATYFFFNKPCLLKKILSAGQKKAKDFRVQNLI